MIISFILYLPGTPGSSLKSTMYLARLDLSPNIINERSTENTLYSNPSADTFWIYPTSYCARVPTDEDNKFSILCSNYSSTYKFNYYDQFPLANEHCKKSEFSTFNRDSTVFTNCLLAFVIFNCLWVIWIALFGPCESRINDGSYGCYFSCKVHINYFNCRLFKTAAIAV